MPALRTFNFLDKLCLGIDQIIRVLTDNALTTGAAYPAEDCPEVLLDEKERQHAAALMRVNHAGEIAAQGLYHGQQAASRTLLMQEQMQRAALEEGDHLAWCKQRIDELGSHTSYLNPLWYTGSFCIGMAAGMAGDKWSLGFVAETERQVIKHLKKHMDLLPDRDARSARILAQMEKDEAKHRTDALTGGAHIVPQPIQGVMAFTAKIMVKTAYWV